jgi:hypothetical protein
MNLLLFTLVGQTIAFRGLFGRACGPRNFMKKRPALGSLFAEWSLFGGLLFSSTSAGFSTLLVADDTNRSSAPPKQHLSEQY